MEGFSRRDALGSIAGAVLGLGFAPLHADAQYIMSGKEKAGQKKGPRYAVICICTVSMIIGRCAIVSVGF
jgi:hypothetical protein